MRHIRYLGLFITRNSFSNPLHRWYWNIFAISFYGSDAVPWHQKLGDTTHRDNSSNDEDKSSPDPPRPVIQAIAADAP